jgi:hypothetical protein
MGTRPNCCGQMCSGCREWRRPSRRPDTEKITEALQARATPLGLAWEYQGELLYRDFVQHREQCTKKAKATEKGAS